MEPLSSKSFRIVLAIGITLVLICVGIMVVDNSHMKYSSSLLSDYTPCVNDELEYRIELDGEVFEFEIKIQKIEGDIYGFCEKENMKEQILDTDNAWIPYCWVMIDLEKMTEGLQGRHSDMCEHTTDFATLTCREYKYKGNDVTFTSIWPQDLFGIGNTFTGKISLKIWSYNGHLFDYELTSIEPNGTSHYMRISLVQIELAA